MKLHGWQNERLGLRYEATNGEAARMRRTRLKFVLDLEGYIDVTVG